MGRSINVASALKLYGYSIQREASEILASELRNIGPSEHDKWYDDLVESLQRQSLTSNVLSVKSVQLALKEIGKDGLQVNDEQAEDEPILSVIDAFETPRFVYNEETTKYDRSRE